MWFRLYHEGRRKAVHNIVVAGGHSKCAVSGKINCNDKTELLDISLSGQEWIEGMHN